MVEEKPHTWLYSALGVQQYTIKRYISASFIWLHVNPILIARCAIHCASKIITLIILDASLTLT